MKLNDIDLASYLSSKNQVTFVLMNTTLNAVAALDGSDLKITDEDSDVALFSGYEICDIHYEGDNIVAVAVRELDETTSEAINALDTNVGILSNKVNKMAPAMNVAKIYVSNSTTISNSEIGDISDLIPDWKPDISYKQGQLVKYDNKVYRLAQDTTSSDIFKPGEGTESIYTLIDLAEDGVRVWHMPTDATNSFALGELAHYPTASDPIYRSKRNGNTSEPTKDEWWELAE